MLVDDAQREMRTVYKGGYIGQAVSGAVWLVSAALGAWVDTRYGLISLFVGGFFIFPLTQLALKLAGLPASLSSGNPLQSLAKQVAFIVPLCLPVIAAATLYNVNWFYPAFAVVVGAHYLPFVFLYGIWQYAVLAAVLIASGVGIAMYLPETFTLGGWFTGAILVAYALVMWWSARRAAVTAQETRPGRV